MQKWINIFKGSPKIIRVPIQVLYSLVPRKVLTGKNFKKIYKETELLLDQSEYWTKKEHARYQLRQIRLLVNHAYNTVPYYQELFKKIGFHPRDIVHLEDIRNIPVLTKDIIRKNQERLISSKFKKGHLLYKTTGGSTGYPLGFYVDRDEDLAKELAFVNKLYERIGYKGNERTFVLRGRIINGRNKLFRYDKHTNEFFASSYHLNDSNIHLYTEALIDSNSVCIKAYPSSISSIAKFILQKGIEDQFNHIKWVILSSEKIYNYQREELRKSFPNAQIFGLYGHTEHGVLAGQCSVSSHYHIQTEYGYTEIVNNSGNICLEEDEIGEIITTGFNNYAMPLIRYKTGDLGIHSNLQCSCGRQYPLLKDILGREQEYLVTKNGTKISLTSIIHSQHMTALGNIKEFQLVQYEIGRVLVNVVVSSSFSKKDIKEIQTKMSKATNGNLEVTVNLVQSIERTMSGKFKFLIQHL